MRDHAITFHLPKRNPPSRLRPLRAARQNLYRNSRTRVNLVVHHVLETLVVCRAEVNLSLKLASGVSVIHDLETTDW